ncbi:MAG: InlB B-repeat-containing protein [Planctomycetota bacterium]|jgi:formylglycine-generating enzyme required for sulfatase activity
MEFIILAILAVLSITIIVLSLAKKMNTAPIAVSGSVVTQENTPKSITITGSDENGDQLTYSVIAGPAHGQLGGTAPNLTYNPETNFHGSDSFSFKVNDGEADSDVAVVSIEVQSATASVVGKIYSLTITAPHGSVKKNPDQANYDHGKTVTLEAVPNKGYSFTNWSGDLSGGTNPATLVMDADKSVSAGFALRAYGLTVTAGDGSVTKNPDQANYSHGETITLEAVPNTGHRFLNWTGDLSGNTNPATLVMDADKSVSAGFALKTYSLKVTAGDGSVTKSPNKTSYKHGETVTLEAVPNKDYSFTNWSGDLSGGTNPTTLVMDADKSVTAGFALKTYSLIVIAGDGSITKSPNKTSYNHGEAVTLEAVPNKGYSFSNWTGDLSGNTNPTTLVMETAKSVTAGFALKTYSLTVTAADGSVTKNPDQANYNHGETVTLEAVPNKGYSFLNWTGDLSGNTNPATLIMETAKSVTAGFALKTYSLTITAGDGSVTKSPPQTSYNRGETVALEAVPNTGYSFTNWSGDLSGSTNPATLVIDADKSVTASFTLTAKVSDVITNSIGMKLVYVPAGSFMMGSSRSAEQLAEEHSEGQGRFEDEFPQHPVRISKGFWMGQTEVTQSQYTSVMNAQPWSAKAYVREDANNPAVYVSWDDAVEFCRKLSQQEGRMYRLPTEAEWEYACRAGTATRFGFGESDLPLGDYAWFNGNADKAGQDYAHPVGQKKPNPWGMYDMHGNVLEWCSDYYDEKYYSNSPSVDPYGPSSGISHSVRGGSWDNGPSYLRCSYRSDYPVSCGLLVGFRVVNDGKAVSDIAAVPVEVESVIDRPKTNEDSVKAQDDAPIDVKAQEDTPIAVKVPANDTAPDGDKLAVVDATQGVTIGTDRTLTYASDNAYNILDQAAVDARDGKVEQAQAALSLLLKDKDAAVMAGYELGLLHYEDGEVDKAMPFFKDALSSAFPGPASGKDEQALTSLLNQEGDAARIRYELGLICQSQSKQDQAAKLFRDGLNIISSKGATYIGVKKCKSCHFKQWNSWRKTKMAKAFELLKPGVRSEEKTKLNFDPNKDHTKDAMCLRCHTSGFGIPGGYVVPADGDAEAQEQADDNAGVTCEGCHGPGSKSVEIQEDIKENKRPYKFAELQAVGFHKAGVRSCTSCHNASDPGKGPGYHFAYEEKRKEGQHENIELKYRQD